MADLNHEQFGDALPRLQKIASVQSEQRIKALTDLAVAGEQADLATGSPCLFCLNTLGKTPWGSLTRAAGQTSLPVLR